MSTNARAVGLDYETNPNRFRVGAESARMWGSGDVHEEVSERLTNERLEPVLDLGCGEGRLGRLLSENRIHSIGLDISPTMLKAVAAPAVLGDATKLPFDDASFGAVVALYMLYHLPEPQLVLRESYRVLRPGGLFVAATPNRSTDPEFAPHLSQEPTTFDAEDAPEIVAGFFANVEVKTWDAPSIALPDHAAVATYLFGRGIAKPRNDELARQYEVPLKVTKRGCLVWARKDG